MKLKIASHSFDSGWKGLNEARLLDSVNTLVIAFCSSKYFKDTKAISEIQNSFPKATIVGCSTAGEILREEVHLDSLCLVSIQFERATFHVESIDNIDMGHSQASGITLARRIKKPNLKGMFILSDGLTTNGSSLAEGIDSVIDTSKVAVSGCLAGDGSDFRKTWQIDKGQIVSGKVVAIGLYGSIELSQGTAGGWDKFGLERVITQSQGNVVYEIDHRPALQLYSEYLGERASSLPASGLYFPIQIKSSKYGDRPLIRTLLAINRDSQSLTFAGDVPAGSIAQLMKANTDRIVDGAGEAATKIKDFISSADKDRILGDTLALAVSCVGRRLVLGHRSVEEVDAIGEILGNKSHLIGMYSYGELAPSAAGLPCELHNQSMTLLCFRETLDE